MSPFTTPKFLAIFSFFSPHLFATLVSLHDIIKISKKLCNGFSVKDIKTYFDTNYDSIFGCYALRCHSNLCKSQEI